MPPLSYARPPPPPHSRPSPSHSPKPQPCALPFTDALRAAAAAAAISLSLLTGDAAGSGVGAVVADQPVEMCRDGAAGREAAEVRAEEVTNEQLVKEAWEVVNEGFLPDAGSRPWSPELWMQRKQDILEGSVKSRSRAHDINKKMLASLGDPYTRFLSPSDHEESEERAFVLKFSAIEIYNEVVRYLPSAENTALRLWDEAEKGTYVENLTEATLRDWNHLRDYFCVNVQYPLLIAACIIVLLVDTCLYSCFTCL